ncbi:hypothetical protein JCM10213_004834 [Rhodosporidiobolus nylandii]
MSHSYAAASLCFGARITFASLFFAHHAFLVVHGPLLAVRLVQICKATGTLDAEVGAVERMPVEMWDKVLDKLEEMKREVHWDKEDEMVARMMCSSCEEKLEGKDRPRWHEQPALDRVRERYRDTWRCEECFKKGWNLMRSIVSADVQPLLAGFGLKAEWRKWPDRFMSDREAIHHFRTRELSDGASDSDSDGSVSSKAGPAQLPRPDARSPLEYTLVTPILPKENRRRLLPRLHAMIEWDAHEAPKSSPVSVQRLTRTLGNEQTLGCFRRLADEYDLVFETDRKAGWREEVDGPRWMPGLEVQLELKGEESY